MYLLRMSTPFVKVYVLEDVDVVYVAEAFVSLGGVIF